MGVYATIWAAVLVVAAVSAVVALTLGVPSHRCSPRCPTPKRPSESCTSQPMALRWAIQAGAGGQKPLPSAWALMRGFPSWLKSRGLRRVRFPNAVGETT